jgi:hypothetical protein
LHPFGAEVSTPELLNVVTADFSVAKAVAGIRDDWRFFFILTGRY